MQFIVKRWPFGDKQGWAFLFLNDRLETLCSLAAPEDTITDWHGAWLKWARHQPGRERFDNFLANTNTFPTCEVEPESFSTFMRVLFGLLEFLQSAPDVALSNRDAALPAIKAFLDRHFTFRQHPQDDYAILLVVNGQPEIVKLDPRRLRYQPNPACVSMEDWWVVLMKKKTQADSRDGNDFVEDVFQYYEFLYPAAMLQQNGFVMKSFVTFTRALVERLEHDDLYQAHRPRLEDMYAVIVCYEGDLNIARELMLHLLRFQEPTSEKWQRLTYLIHDLKRSRRGMGRETDALRRDEDERLATLTGLIADHYLDKYDLPRATDAWRQLGLKNFFLRTLLFFIEHSRLILLFHGVAFLIVTGLALMQLGAWLPFPRLLPLVPSLSRLMLLLLFLGPFWASIGVLYNLFRKRLYYGQLFLPRLYGAIVVGLSVLLLDDLPWKIGIQITGPILLLFVVNVLFLSYLYVRFDVYQTIKFEPWSASTRKVQRSKTMQQLRRLSIFKRLRKESPSPPKRAKSTFAYARLVAWQIFSIGLIQSFLVTVLVSGLLLPLVLKIFGEGSPDSAPLLQNSLCGWIDIELGGVSFIFVPTLVLLWTSMALFIGAFAQLLWQGRHVTSPVSE